jgi:GTP-binding protein Era
MGIVTLDTAQIIFVDTPGVHRPRHKLGENMNQEAVKTLEEADLILFLVEADQPPDEEDRMLADAINRLRRPVQTLLVLNKIDLVDAAELVTRRQPYSSLVSHAVPLAVSASVGTGLDTLTDEIIARLPEHPPFFPEDLVTDLYERDLAADLIREAALNILRDEVPHGIAIRIDQFIERGEEGAYIEATIFVERESHKGIVIGQGGSMLKQIGSAARREIESMSGRKVFLQLRVKVRKNWRDDEKVLRGFGF